MKTFLFALILAVLTFLIVSVSGCAAQHPATTAVTHSITSTPTALKGVAVSLDWIIILSLLALGGGIGLFFALPASHNISLPLAIIAGAVEATALLARVSLWIIPWVAGGLGVIALGVFVYEVYRNRAKLEAAISFIPHIK